MLNLRMDRHFALDPTEVVGVFSRTTGCEVLLAGGGRIGLHVSMEEFEKMLEATLDDKGESSAISG